MVQTACGTDQQVMGLDPSDLQDLVLAYMAISSLEWRDIEGDVLRLCPGEVKNSKGRLLILMGEIGEIVERRRTERIDLIPWSFHREG